MPDIYDVLACPTCKVAVTRLDDELRCGSCNAAFPIIDGVPIMMSDGRVPDLRHEQDLGTFDVYFPWIHRLVLQSLLDDQVVLEIGSGNRAYDDPAVIRMDVVLTPHADVVADAHALPFLSDSLDFIFSLAVVEHLRQPFLVADEMHRALKDGGYVYNECNFVFAYHGYPHHYFNASIQGLQQVFSSFRELRTGVAPYQMPSQALLMVLGSYLRDFKPDGIDRGVEFAQLLTAVLQEELIDFDRGFSEEAAALVAAGTYFFGMKQTAPTSSCLPAPVIEAWKQSTALQERFPDPVNLGTVDNLLVWARDEGAAEHSSIREHLDAITPFAKHGDTTPYDRSALRLWPLVEPVYGTVFDYPDAAPPRKERPTIEPASEQPPATAAAPARGEVAGRVRLRSLASRITDLWRYWRNAGTAATTRRVVRTISARLR
jgi:uncharacterized protein YbaR (Trm112 family)/SAM-dependent methyltransferase